MKDVYICIATRQNTINALPFDLIKDFKSKLKKVDVITTQHAKNDGWDQKIMTFITNEGISVNNPIVDINKLIPTISGLVKGYAKDSEFNGNIYINIGGGTKAMVLDIYRYFLKEKNEKILLLYPNLETGYLDIYKHGDNKEIIDFTTKLNSKISIQKVLQCYGRHIEVGQDKLQIQQNPAFKISNHFDNADFRKTMYDVAKVVNVFEGIVYDIEEQKILTKRIINNINPLVAQSKLVLNTKCQSANFEKDVYDCLNAASLEKVLKFDPSSGALHKDFNDNYLSNVNEGSKGVGRCFEIIVQNFIHDYLPHDKFEKAYNLYINNDIELDVVINKGNGQLLFVECKTIDFVKKDAYSRLKNINDVSGEYSHMVVCFPYFWDDFENAPKDDNGKMENTFLQRLRDLPYELNSKKLDFCIFDNDNEPVAYLWKRAGSNYCKLDIDKLPATETIESKQQEGYIFIRNLTYYLNQNFPK
jgi:hypothetical protein